MLNENWCTNKVPTGIHMQGKRYIECLEGANINSPKIEKIIGTIKEKKIINKQTVWIKSNLKFVLWNLWSELELIFISYLYLFVKNFSVKKKTKTTKNKKTWKESN